MTKQEWDREEFKRARQAKGHTQEEAARQMGITFVTVNRWENGHQIPKGLYRTRVQEYINHWTASNLDEYSVKGEPDE